MWAPAYCIKRLCCGHIWHAMKTVSPPTFCTTMKRCKTSTETDVLYGSVVPFVLSCLLMRCFSFIVCVCVCARVCMCVHSFPRLWECLNGMGKIQLGFNDYLRRRRIYQSLPEYLDSWHQAFFLVNYDKTKLDSNILICCSRESSGKTKNIKGWIPLSFDYFRALALTSGLLLLGCKWAIIDVNMWAAQA